MKCKQTGVAAVEFALILPMLLVLVAMVFELGHAVYRYNTTAKQVRDAVRYLSVQDQNTHITETRNIIVYGNAQGEGSPLDPRLTEANVATPTWQTAGVEPVINTVTVRITGYTYQPMFAQMFGTNFATITFNDITATMRSPL